MNNGRPPYGDPSQWNQQPAAGQNTPAQYGQYTPQAGNYGQQTPDLNGYQQPYGQQGYQQPPASQDWYQQPANYDQQQYQPQQHPAQENYRQQSWTPYGQQAYPQQGYAQQPHAASQGYPEGQPMYQQAAQNQQPLQQQGYPQQTYPQQGYPQQEPQPGTFYPAQGYSGYVSQPKDAEPAISGEVLMKVALFGVLPVLFLLGVLFKSAALCWIFIAAAAAAVAVMWLKDLVDARLKLTASLICGVLCIVALVTALNGAPTRNTASQQGSAGNAGQAGQQGGMNMGMTWEATPTPSPTPTPTVDPYAESGAAVEQLRSFFYFWHVNNDESMLELTAPSWRNSVEKPLTELFRIRNNRTPLDDCEVTSISGTEFDTMRTAKVKVTIDKNINRTPERYSFNVVLLKEDGIWYIDPRSLESNERATNTTAAYNTTPTQPVLNTGSPNTVLYYNPDGGSYYHIDPNCTSTAKKFLPLKGQFLFSQVNDEPYSALKQCAECGAPLRQN